MIWTTEVVIIAGTIWVLGLAGGYVLGVYSSRKLFFHYLLSWQEWREKYPYYLGKEPPADPQDHKSADAVL